MVEGRKMNLQMVTKVILSWSSILVKSKLSFAKGPARGLQTGDTGLSENKEGAQSRNEGA